MGRDSSSKESEFRVVWPLGKSANAPLHGSNPVPDLNGKTVCEVWDGVFKGDQMFPLIREGLRSRFPDVRFKGHEAFGKILGPGESEVVAKLPRLLAENGCDAAIVGVGA